MKLHPTTILTPRQRADLMRLESVPCEVCGLHYDKMRADQKRCPDCRNKGRKVRK